MKKRKVLKVNQKSLTKSDTVNPDPVKYPKKPIR